MRTKDGGAGAVGAPSRGRARGALARPRRAGYQAGMYRGDAFFDLDLLTAAGLLAVLALVTLAALVAVRRLGRGRGIAVRAALACLGFWLFVWVAPLVAELYFAALAGGPPWRIAIDLPPGPATMLGLVTFSGPATLAAHGQGALFWGMLVTALRAGRLAPF